jgi:uncharacterized protein YndB with AHSA1/START domain
MQWDMRAVGNDFFETAPHRFLHKAAIRRPPERVFEAIAIDPAGWGDWFPGFDHTGCWLTEPPPEPGSRRKVRAGLISYEETILALERPHHFAFRVDRAGNPMAKALAEDYRIIADDNGSVLEWTFAIDPTAAVRPIVRLFDPVLAQMLKRAATNLERLLQ